MRTLLDNPDYRDTFTDLWTAGYTCREIADALGISTATVQTWRARLRLPPRRPAPRPRARSDRPATVAVASIGRSCLMCSGPFESDGSHNRICPTCKTTPVWRSGGDFHLALSAQH